MPAAARSGSFRQLGGHQGEDQNLPPTRLWGLRRSDSAQSTLVRPSAVRPECLRWAQLMRSSCARGNLGVGAGGGVKGKAGNPRLDMHL